MLHLASNSVRLSGAARGAINLTSCIGHASTSHHNNHSPNHRQSDTASATNRQSVRNFSISSAATWMSESTPVDLAMQGIGMAHDVIGWCCGIPWGATIMLTGLGIRLLTLPTTVAAEYLRCKRFHIELRMMDKVKGTLANKVGVHSVGNVMRTKEFNKQWAKLVRQSAVANNCTLARITTIALLPFPFWIGTSIAIRNMTGANYMSATAFTAVRSDMAESWMWLDSLLVADPTNILPLSVTTTMLFSIVMMQQRLPVHMPLGTRIQLIVRQSAWAAVGVYLGYLMVVGQLPSGVSLFWATSSLTTIAIQLSLMHPTVKRVLRLPSMPTDTRQPFRDCFRRVFSRFTTPNSTNLGQPPVKIQPVPIEKGIQQTLKSLPPQSPPKRWTFEVVEFDESIKMASHGCIATSLAHVNLPVILRNGQCFRWKMAGYGSCGNPSFIGYYDHRLWNIHQRLQPLDEKTGYDCQLCYNVVVRFSGSGPPDTDKDALKRFFRLDESTSLPSLYDLWSMADGQFASLVAENPALRGIPILHQDPLECLITFICSSNNIIKRISMMVNKLAELYGESKSDESGTVYHDFPTLEQLTANDVGQVEATLRENGFGYRAGYVAKAVRQVLEFGGESWLRRLRSLPYAEAKTEILKLNGVGPKVADCVLLMSLGHDGAIPVDTHVLQVTVKRYPQALSKSMLKQSSLSKAKYETIGDFYRRLFGSHAGWAQSVLFTSNLKNVANLSNNKKIPETETSECDSNSMKSKSKLTELKTTSESTKSKSLPKSVKSPNIKRRSNNDQGDANSPKKRPNTRSNDKIMM